MRYKRIIQSVSIICLMILLVACSDLDTPSTTAGGVLSQPSATSVLATFATTAIAQPTPPATDTLVPVATATRRPTATIAPTATPNIAMQHFGLTFQGQTYPIAQSDIVALAPDGNVNAAKVSDYVKAFADQVFIAPLDATFRYDFGANKVAWRTKGAYGYAVDVPATVKALSNALAGRIGQNVVAAEKQVDATYISTDTPKIGTDVIGEWAIPYDDEDAPTIANIELGAQKINGDIVMPGAVFASDRLLYWDGVAPYQNSLAITGKRTELAPGGGLCLNTTTLFQAAFFAGLPIVQRIPHDYWISVYAATYKGVTYKGLDATVGEFRFRNTTGAPLLVKMWGDGHLMHVRYVGTKPAWTVQLSDYRVWNERPALDGVEYFDEPSLPTGQTDIARNPHAGFQSNLTRIVSDANGKVLDTYRVTNNYIPTRKQILRGTGT